MSEYARIRGRGFTVPALLASDGAASLDAEPEMYVPRVGFPVVHDLLFRVSWGSYYNDPQIHIRYTTGSDEVTHDEWNTLGFRLVRDSVNNNKEDK